MEFKFKRIPWYLKLNPFGQDIIAMASHPYILLSEKLYQEVISGNPSIQTLGIIEHEKAHLRHQESMGTFRMKLKYALSRKFRLEEELYAEESRFAFLKKHGAPFNFETRARRMSGPMYYWMVSYDRASQLLKEVWERV